MSGILRQDSLCIFSIRRRRSFGTTGYKFKGKRKLPLFCYPLYLRLTINRIAKLFDTERAACRRPFFRHRRNAIQIWFLSAIHLPMKTPIDSQAQRSKRSRASKACSLKLGGERTNLLRYRLRSFSIRTCRLSARQSAVCVSVGSPFLARSYSCDQSRSRYFSPLGSFFMKSMSISSISSVHVLRSI